MNLNWASPVTNCDYLVLLNSEGTSVGPFRPFIRFYRRHLHLLTFNVQTHPYPSRSQSEGWMNWSDQIRVVLRLMLQLCSTLVWSSLVPLKSSRISCALGILHGLFCRNKYSTMCQAPPSSFDCIHSYTYIFLYSEAAPPYLLSFSSDKNYTTRLYIL